MNFRESDLVQQPSAAAMCESMRSLGYSLGSAVADLIDNSITASAKNVWISLAETRASAGRRLAILDDGRGMTPDELLGAMRLGSTNPLAPRAPNDLGRFGMGLKTASFSQCRCLTVATRVSTGDIHVLRWDLDHVARTDRWQLLSGPDPVVEPDLELLDTLKGPGTLILWSKIDRIAPDGAEVLTELRQHLALTFHQLIEERDLRIHTSMNNRHQNPNALPPVDPFMRSNAATRPSPAQRIDQGCTLRGYVLPHRDRCTDDEWDAAALGTTWRDRQGCYVYRQRRLIVAGGWLGLNRRWKKDPDTQLARVKIDFDNTWDEKWKLDVMKSRASPPHELRTRLRDLSRGQREESTRIFAYRHRRTSNGATASKTESFDHIPLWKTENAPDGVRFRISEQHPAVSRLIESSPLGGPVMRLIAATLPVPTIWYEFNTKIGTESELKTADQDTTQLRTDLMSYVEYEIANGRKLGEVIASARRMTPYDELQEIVDSVAAELGAE
ncbi:MAG: ATP-binding protein [Byssovorax sp.]